MTQDLYGNTAIMVFIDHRTHAPEKSTGLISQDPHTWIFSLPNAFDLFENQLAVPP